ncbi:MAG: cysteine--tRNA ligase [Pseudomonadota bacterium]|nr:cysteine--tRNA ligase [Pseudomonadota bacterium]
MNAPISLYDSRTREKKVFTPVNPEEVTMYVCGPTVYNFIHIGNARPAVVFDVLFRLLGRHYLSVKFARNITDIDDKINDAAQKQGISIHEFTQTYIDAYRDDLKSLLCNPPSVEPLATDNIGAMIRMIEDLVSKGHAYAAEGHVLFNVKSMPDYGKLSNRSQEELLAGARVEVAPYKQDPSDFVLWKPSSDDLPGWDSPWGRGRPGWHIECSAMIREVLGERIDIHGGGIDLTFPHHENERAQSNCCTGHEFVGTWMHNGYLNMAGEKMSKSLGNFVTLRSLLESHRGEVLRYALLNAHYRAPLEWSEDLLQQAKTNLDRFYQIIRDEADQDLGAANVQDLIEPLEKALCDDLNSPQALAALHQIANQYFKAESKEDKVKYASALFQAGSYIGLLTQSAQDWFQSASAGVDADAIEALIVERQEAKKARDFARADAIRDELAAQGVILEDSPQGTRWSLK